MTDKVEEIASLRAVIAEKEAEQQRTQVLLEQATARYQELTDNFTELHGSVKDATAKVKELNKLADESIADAEKFLEELT